MGLVDGDATDRGFAQIGDHVVAQQSLGRNVEQAQRPLADSPRDPAALLDVGGGIEAPRLDAELPQLGDLVAHERDQRRHDERQAFADDGRKLKAERLAATGRHHGEHVLPLQNGRQDLLLTRAEGGEAEDARERFASLGHERRLLLHAGVSGSKTGVHCTASTRSAPVASITRRSKPSAAPHASGICAERVEEILVDRAGRPIYAPLLGHVGFEPPPLLVGIEQFMEGVGELHAAAIELETLGDAPSRRGSPAQARLRSRDSRRGSSAVPSPSLGSTCSLSRRLKMSDHVSSAATRTPASLA